MEALSVFTKEYLPNYFQSLPVPNSVSGFASLTGYEWVTLAIFTTGATIIFIALLKLLLPRSRKPPLVNLTVKKDNPKVVDVCEIEDLGKEKAVYCRCWRSSKFPLCDGTHNEHNEKAGDNVGPLIIRHKPS